MIAFRSGKRLLLLLAIVALAWAGGDGLRAQSKATQSPRMRSTTIQQRRAAAAARTAKTPPGKRTTARAATLVPGPDGLLVPDYFGNVPNYANSPLPVVTGVDLNELPIVLPGTGLRKFVDRLPGLGPTAANGLGQFIPVATPDVVKYPGNDYYEIELIQYSEQMHSDLPATRLRGYRQTNNGTDTTSCNGAGQPACTTADNTIAPPAIAHYLGPFIVGQRDRPVRVKFTNNLPVGTGGNLFIPTDTTYMGAGDGPISGQKFTQNRATLHLHGGTTPWISDGTPHQWTTPAGETTAYPKGVSVKNVPDMDGGTEPDGTLTFFYSNQQSARLMFYHDHAYGITRLNVYSGEAAGYLLTDPVEQGLVNSGVIPAEQIPLVIQDKTFVPDDTRPFTNLAQRDLLLPWPSQLAAQDPTWDSVKYGGFGSLWFPHVYMPNQNPFDLSGANVMGRWDYGPWFWPPFTGLQFGPVPNPYSDAANAPWEPPQIPGTPNPSGVPEAFMDTPIVNGTAYPFLEVQPKAYRLRILNAANDRFLNLSLFTADGSVSAADSRTNTEVRMVPFDSSASGIPADWGTRDGRAGGVPDPATRGPAMIQIGTEGGFLPAPVVVKNQPVNYNYNRRDITVLNVLEKALFLGPAERADVVVDFSNFAGKTLILYNDAPAPVPAVDPRLDYFTGDQDMTDVGGAPSTLVGYGPNTRTVMQIRVGGIDTGSPGPINDVYAATLAALNTAIPAAFAATQETIIVPQSPYNTVYNGSFPAGAAAYVRIQDSAYSFTPIGQTAPLTMQLEPKAIIEDFQMDYGRMNALLGVEIKNTNITNQTSIIQGYLDPPTEVVKFADRLTPIGAAGDGTQLWKVTHNGVDTHAIHFHMFNVQIVNRVGWDGAIRPPDANELGWKDTIRTNPLEDIIIAARPIALTNVPFKLPNSVRPLDVTRPVGSLTGFTNINPLGSPVTVANDLTNFGWEFVWHCHLLGHEENDMMRPMALAVAPEAPGNLLASVIGKSGKRTVALSWTDNSLNATNFTVQRAADPTFATNLVSFSLGMVTTYTDVIGTNTQPLFYRVFASNIVGSTAPGYPRTSADSGFSNTSAVNPLLAPTSVTALVQFGPVVLLTFTDNATNETGFVVERSTGGAPFAQIAALAAHTNTGLVTYTDATVPADTISSYRVKAISGPVSSAYTNTATVTLGPIPDAPSSLAATAVRVGGQNDSVTVTWTDNASNETGFQLQRSTNQSFTNGMSTTSLPANTVTTTQTGVSAGVTYFYRIRAINLASASGWSNTFSIRTP